MKRRRGNLRRVWALLLLLAGGAIINVAVAWVLLLYAPQAAQTSVARFQPPPQGTGSEWGWDVFSYGSGAAVRTIANVRTNSQLPPGLTEREVFPRWSNWSEELDAISSIAAAAFAAGATGDSSHPIIATQMFEACGWPMLAMQAHWDGRNASVDHTRRWRWGISRTAVVPMSPSTNGIILNDLKVIPFGPMWPGFAVNTLFYAAILCMGWLSFAVPLALRRRRRIRRGLCSKCGYDLRNRPTDSPACPECGAATNTTDSKAVQA